MVNIPLFAGFHTSQVVSRISSINSSFQTYGTWSLANFTGFTRKASHRKRRRTTLQAIRAESCWGIKRLYKLASFQIQRVSFKCSRLAKTSKAGVRKFYPHGKFCQSRKKKNTHYLLYPFGWFLWPPKKHNSPSWWNNHLPVLPGVWVATRNAGILVIKVPPRLQGDFEAQMSQNLIVVGMVAWPTSILYTYYKYIYIWL